MAVRLHINKDPASQKDSELHLMPCKIHGDESAKVSSFFKPYIRKVDEERKQFERKMLTKCDNCNDTGIRRDCDYYGTDSSFAFADYECSFRGYPLQGKKVTVPAGYKGMTFVENKKTDTEGKNRNLYCTGTFSQFTYWNYDRIPSKNDALSAALDWIDIADALHTSET